MSLIARNDVIAGVLNRNGLKTGHDNRWTRERVTGVRSSYGIPVYREAADGSEPWLNLSQAATIAGVAPRTLRLAVERGEIAATHPLADGPWIFTVPVSTALPFEASRNARSSTKNTPRYRTLRSKPYSPQ